MEAGAVGPDQVARVLYRRERGAWRQVLRRKLKSAERDPKHSGRKVDECCRQALVLVAGWLSANKGVPSGILSTVAGRWTNAVARLWSWSRAGYRPTKV